MRYSMEYPTRPLTDYSWYKIDHNESPAILIVRKLHDAGLNSTALLNELHWLPIGSHTEFKMVTIRYETYRFGTPSYLASSLPLYMPSLMLRFSNKDQLTVPELRIKLTSRFSASEAIFASLVEIPSGISACCRDCKLVQVTFKDSSVSSIFHVTVELQLRFRFN